MRSRAAVPVKRADVPLCRMGDVPDLTADPTLAERELGFLAKEDLDSMCRDLW